MSEVPLPEDAPAEGGPVGCCGAGSLSAPDRSNDALRGTEDTQTTAAHLLRTRHLGDGATGALAVIVSNKADECRFGITWRIADSARLGQRLGKFGVSVPLGREVQYGQLFAWGHDQRPRLVGWLPLDERLHATVNREMKDKSHSLARWLERQPALDFSALALGWSFYWHHLLNGTSTAWPAHLRRAFPRDPMLDDVLALSKGWLLWDHQLQLLVSFCRPQLRFPNQIAVSLRERNPMILGWLERAKLPNGISLSSVLELRCHPDAQCPMPLEREVVTRLASTIFAASPTTTTTNNFRQR